MGGATLPYVKREAIMDIRIEEQKKKAMIRAAVIRGGFKLIKLILIKENMRRISAVEVIVPVIAEDEATGKKGYQYLKKSDRIQFELDDMAGVFTAEVIDSPKNRRFLASMQGAGIFEIEDKAIAKEIEKMSKVVQEQVIKIKAKPTDILNDEPAPEPAPEPDKETTTESDEIPAPDKEVVPKQGNAEELAKEVVPAKSKKTTKRSIVEIEDE
jgi:hypothetical protein